MSTDSTNELEKSLNNKLALIKPKKLVLSDEKPLADLAKMPSSETSDTELLYVSEEAVFAQRYKDLMGGLKSTENDKLVEISETISGLQKEVFSSKELTQNTFDFTTKNLPLKKVYQQPYNSTTEGTSMTDVFEKLREKTYQTEWNGKIPVNTETKDRVEFSLFTNDESNLGVISPYVKCLSDPDGDPELLKASSKELLKQLVPFMCKENGLFFTLVHGGLKSFQEGEDLIKPTNFNVMYHVFSAFGDLPLPYISNAVIDILIKAEIPPELDEISTSSLDATTDEFLEKTKIIQEETINKIDKTEKETHESVESWTAGRFMRNYNIIKSLFLSKSMLYSCFSALGTAAALYKWGDTQLAKQAITWLMDYSSTGSSQVTMSESKGLIPGVAPVAIPAVKAGVFAITALMYLDKSYIALRSIFVSIFGDYR